MISKANKSGKKSKYKVRNWSKYNKALENRGSITIWFSEEHQKGWYADHNKNKVGAPFIYSDLAIEIGLTLKTVFHLGLRQLVGFLKSVVSIQNLKLQIPSYSVFSKRASGLNVSKIKRLQKNGEAINVVVDSTGLKVYGEGEWKEKKHGSNNKKIWRKLHLAVDDNSRIIFSSELTTLNEGDSSLVEPLLEEHKNDVESFTGDGAYDAHDIYSFLEQDCNASHISIPPRKNSQLNAIRENNMDGRDHQVVLYRSLGADEWVTASAYRRQNIAENAMYRYKQIIGRKMSARLFDNQKTESEIGVMVLNKMALMGMPESYRV